MLMQYFYNSRLENNPQPNMFGTGSEKDTLEHIAPYVSTDTE